MEPLPGMEPFQKGNPELIGECYGVILIIGPPPLASSSMRPPMGSVIMGFVWPKGALVTIGQCFNLGIDLRPAASTS